MYKRDLLPFSDVCATRWSCEPICVVAVAHQPAPGNERELAATRDRRLTRARAREIEHTVHMALGP